MRNTISKAIVAGVAALSLAAAVVATTEPASAQQFHGFHGGGGWHGGGGGWHGGGWGGRGWHGGGWGGRGWHGGGWGGGGWWGPAVVAGLAAGAIATSAYPYYGYSDYGYSDYGYSDPCWQVRPVYSVGGVYLGNRTVNVC
jgi:hypothetical protein